MTRRAVRIGTRGSALALAQAQLVADAFERAGQPASLVRISTVGDRRRPDTAWGEGAFVTAIEEALVRGQVDVAVHSAKDIPTDEDDRLRIGAYLERADPRDALVTNADIEDLDQLTAGARIGTDSPRRTGFLLAKRPDLDVHPLHGNVDTRLRRLQEGETDALVLACAGLDRLGFSGRISTRLDPDIVPPAPGQGAIAIQLRGDRGALLASVAALDHAETRVAVETERAFLLASGGGCRSPIGALATVDGNDLQLLGGRVNPDGSAATVMRLSGPVHEARPLATELARALLPEPELRPRSGSGGSARPRVLVTRPRGQAESLALALRRFGLEPVIVPAIEVDAGAPVDALADALRDAGPDAWVVITSSNGAHALAGAVQTLPSGAPLNVAAVGAATRKALEEAGIDVAHQPDDASAASLAASLPVRPGERVVIVRGNLSSDVLSHALRTRGAVVDEIVAYTTHEAPAASRPLLRAALAGGPFEAVILASGSAARGLVNLANGAPTSVLSIPAVCIGPETAFEARRTGFSILAVASARQAEALADATARALAPRLQEDS